MMNVFLIMHEVCYGKAWTIYAFYSPNHTFGDIIWVIFVSQAITLFLFGSDKIK